MRQFHMMRSPPAVLAPVPACHPPPSVLHCLVSDVAQATVSGRPGAAYVDIPADVLFAELHGTSALPPPPPRSRPHAGADALQQAVKLLASARRWGAGWQHLLASLELSLLSCAPDRYSHPLDRSMSTTVGTIADMTDFIFPSDIPDVPLLSLLRLISLGVAPHLMSSGRWW